jgi:transcriptional regulator with XRE-family HTH domain
LEKERKIMNYNPQITGEFIKSLRNERTLSQEYVADYIGINIRTYKRAEKGTAGLSIDTLCAISEYYGVSIDSLILGHRTESEWAHMMSGLSETERAQIASIALYIRKTIWGNVR